MLENRRALLEHELTVAMQQASDAAYAGKPETGVQMWLARTSAELHELRYALAVLYRQNERIELPGRAVVLVIVAMVAILVAQIAILVWVM